MRVFCISFIFFIRSSFPRFIYSIRIKIHRSYSPINLEFNTFYRFVYYNDFVKAFYYMHFNINLIKTERWLEILLQNSHLPIQVLVCGLLQSYLVLIVTTSWSNFRVHQYIHWMSKNDHRISFTIGLTLCFCLKYVSCQRNEENILKQRGDTKQPAQTHQTPVEGENKK